MTQILTRLIALTAIFAVDFGLAADVAEGAEFDATPEQAEALLTAGKAALANAQLSEQSTVANPPAPTPKGSTAKTVKARVLVTGQYGEVNELVSLPADVAKSAEEHGQIDTSKAAVAYAASMQAAAE